MRFTTLDGVQKFQTPTGNASTQGIMYIYVGNDEKICILLVVPLQSQKHHSTKNKQSIKRRI